MTKERATTEDILRDLRTWDRDEDVPRGPDGLLGDAADEIEQLRGNLSLAEEGLASATQEIAQLQAAGKILVDEGDRHLTEYNAEIERLRKALTSVQNLAGGHPIECECRQCEIFELLEPIVGNISPRSAHEPEGGK